MYIKFGYLWSTGSNLFRPFSDLLDLLSQQEQQQQEQQSDMLAYSPSKQKVVSANDRIPKL